MSTDHPDEVSEDLAEGHGPDPAASKEVGESPGSSSPIPGALRRRPRKQGRRGLRGEGFALTLALRLIAAGPLFVLFCLWVAFAFLSPYFFTRSNLTNILVQSCSTALLALGALVAVVVGSLDLSLGATAGLTTIIGAVTLEHHPHLWWLIAPAMVATAIAVGVVNSFIVVTLRIGNAFIVTLGMLYAVQSLSYVESGGAQVPGVPHYFLTLANGHVAGIPAPVIFVLVAAAALAFFLNRVVWGRWIVAIGGNADSAGKVGIPVRKVLFSVYVLAAFFAALTGILIAGLDDAGVPDSGTSVLLAIAAVVIGGASLSGGRGSVWATLVGAVTLGSITNGLTLMSVSPNWTPFAIGAVLIAAVAVDALRSRVEGRLRVRQARIQAEAS